MRKLMLAALCAAALSACGGNSTTTVESSNRAAPTTPTPATQTTLAHGPSASAGLPPVASGHGAPASPAPAAPPGDAGPDTAALDSKIAAALVKAKAPNASAADKQAAAAAYMERGNVYWGAGIPSLYKRALADFNSVLLYQPGNEEAQNKKAEIIRIYQGMGRPVPDYSNEQ